MERKGQGALEYLLLIGGAVLIAVIVIAVVTGMANNVKTGVQTGANCASLGGCQTCLRAAANACAAFDSSNNQLFVSTGVTNATCSASNAKNFSYCKAA